MSVEDNEKAKVFIFSDGSKESQVLEFESSKNPYITITKVKVDKADPSNIESYIAKLPKSVLNSNDITRVHLHFTQEDFNEYNIAEQKNQLAAKYPNLAIFYAYELMSRDVAAMRHAGYFPLLSTAGAEATITPIPPATEEAEVIPIPTDFEEAEEATPAKTKTNKKSKIST